MSRTVFSFVKGEEVWRDTSTTLRTGAWLGAAPDCTGPDRTGVGPSAPGVVVGPLGRSRVRK